MCLDHAAVWAHAVALGRRRLDLEGHRIVGVVLEEEALLERLAHEDCGGTGSRAGGAAGPCAHGSANGVTPACIASRHARRRRRGAAYRAPGGLESTSMQGPRAERGRARRRAGHSRSKRISFAGRMSR